MAHADKRRLFAFELVAALLLHAGAFQIGSLIRLDVHAKGIAVNEVFHQGIIEAAFDKNEAYVILDMNFDVHIAFHKMYEFEQPFVLMSFHMHSPALSDV